MTEKQKIQAWDWYDKVTKGLIMPAIIFAALSYINLQKTMIVVNANVKYNQLSIEKHVDIDKVLDKGDVRECMRMADGNEKR